MQVKAGVDIRGIQPELVFGLTVANDVFGRFNAPLTITAVVNGHHMAGSLHCKGLAADLRSHEVNVTDKEKLLAELKEALGSQWDVILEAAGTANEHYHMEFDPKT